MDISVVISTYNRCGLLDQSLKALLNQVTRGLAYEIIVVDNNSTDGTAQKIQSYAGCNNQVKYVFEPRQGVSYGRNAGIQLACSDFIAFCDDDVFVAPDWLQNLYDALKTYPKADFIGGKVVPVWNRKPPKWLAIDMPPLALQDHGDKSFVVSLENPICLISASLGVRRNAFSRAGLFDPKTQRIKDSVGSTEDADWELKIWQRGGRGVYVPEVVCYCEVPQTRMKKAYHRRWYLGHGKSNALTRRCDFDGGRSFLDVPLYLYRQALKDLVAASMNLLKGQSTEAFLSEAHILFCAGFIWQRWKAALLGKVTEAVADHSISFDSKSFTSPELESSKSHGPTSRVA